ncbi:MAG: TetR family transcriptional regulator [Coriobacteriia bacterium]|nr:TetR family transcriptional regulator [Coriobacteriia bacterium]
MATRAENTRSRMFDAALQLISEKGFSGTTVDEIVDRAGVAKGTVYYHFAGKAELVEALIAEQLAPLVVHFRTAAAGAYDPMSRIDALIRAELEWIRENRAFAKMLVTELWREDRMWRETLVLLRREIIGFIRDAIDDGVKNGAIRSDIDPDFAASALFGMTVTAALDWLVFDPDKSLEFVAEQVLRLASMAVSA